MLKTSISTDIGVTVQDNDCILVSFLSNENQEKVKSLLDELSLKLKDIIWPMPKSALHITLCEIIQPKLYEEDKELLFKNLPQYKVVLKDVLKRNSIRVFFDAIEVSPQAIIIKGHDNGSFNSIRNLLVKELPLPTETKLPPSIIHCTIARFKSSVDLEKIKTIIDQSSINFEENVDTFKLLINTSPHLLNYEIEDTYSLI
jgi:2'-5' RNA ligase